MALSGVQSGNETKTWLKLLTAVIAAQLLLWLVIDPLIYSKPDISGKINFDKMEVAKIDAPTEAAITKARFEQVKTPWSDCCSGGYRIARYHYSLASLPRDGFLASTVAAADNVEIYVNGQLAFSHGRMDRDRPTYHGGKSRYFSLPSALFQTGGNYIDVVMVRAKNPWFDAGLMVFGERAKLIAGYDARLWIVHDFALLSIGLGIGLSLLALVIAIRSDDRAVALWTALTASAWVMWATHYQWNDPPFSAEGRLFNYYIWQTLLPFCWLGLVNAWTGNRSWKFNIALGLGFLGATVAIWWQIYHGGETGYDMAGDISTYGGIVVLAATVINFLWHFRRGVDVRIAETVIIGLCVTVLACELYWEIRWDTVFGRIRTLSIPLVLLFVIAFVARNVRLFQSSEHINALLQAQLTERTAELEAAHVREKELVRTHAHQSERQRIMRDMHDGLGSQLMSMLLAARRGVAKPAVVAEGLQSVVDEMRLLIDSMDSVGESLGSAFVLFRERMQGRVEEAGMAFKWHDSSGGKLPDLGPRDVLQVFRIMQEAVTNALKHAGGSTLSVTISPSLDPSYSIRIGISDNGKGMGKANPRGKGLESMASRAETIGARIETQSTPDGVRQFLDLEGFRAS